MWEGQHQLVSSRVAGVGVGAGVGAGAGVGWGWGMRGGTSGG